MFFEGDETMNIKSQKDFFSGLMFMAVGVAFAWGASTYTIGTGARMGAGFFPLVLGVLLAVLGGVITFKALVVETVDGDKIGSFAWKPLFFIIAANLVFGVMIGGLPSWGIPKMGLVVGIYALTIIASFAAERVRWVEVFILGTALTVLSYLAFIVLLNLQFPVWPAFISN
jgi:Tripartite tricarboxylate transporter TctB family